MLLRSADIFFIVFHTSLIVFNLSGWMWRRTRKLNLAVLILTGASWIILGLIVGTIGYCPLTDWHFKILEKLGETDLPWSYVKYLTDRLTGSDVSPEMADKATTIFYLMALLISLALNTRDFLRRRDR